MAVSSKKNPKLYLKTFQYYTKVQNCIKLQASISSLSKIAQAHIWIALCQPHQRSLRVKVPSFILLPSSSNYSTSTLRQPEHIRIKHWKVSTKPSLKQFECCMQRKPSWLSTHKKIGPTQRKHKTSQNFLTIFLPWCILSREHECKRSSNHHNYILSKLQNPSALATFFPTGPRFCCPNHRTQQLFKSSNCDQLRKRCSWMAKTWIT